MPVTNHTVSMSTEDKSSSTAIEQAEECDGYEHNEFCIVCRDGACGSDALLCCNYCPRVTCQECINIPDDIRQVVGDPNVAFKCIICHIGEQKEQGQEGPYFGFYRNGRPILNGFLPILGALEISLKAQISCAPVLFLHLILVDFDAVGSPFELAYHFLKPYFPQGGLQYQEITFDVATNSRAATYERKVNKLLQDLLLLPRWARVVIAITNHADDTTGGQFAGYEGKEYVSGKVHHVLDLLLEPWKEITDRAQESYLWFFSCGGMHRSHKITATVAFSAATFHPSFTSHLLLAFVELVLIERCPIVIAFPHMLGQSHKLGRHTDILFMHRDSVGGALTVVKYSWGNIDVRPWGQYLPIQCPNCGWTNAWRSANKAREVREGVNRHDLCAKMNAYKQMTIAGYNERTMQSESSRVRSVQGLPFVLVLWNADRHPTASDSKTFNSGLNWANEGQFKWQDPAQQHQIHSQMNETDVGLSDHPIPQTGGECPAGTVFRPKTHSQMNETNVGFTDQPIPQTGGKCPAGTVLLQDPILEFSIPTVRAECVFDLRAGRYTYGPPEEVDMVDYETQEVYQIYRVPVLKDRNVEGYIPLPMRYHAVWMELSYTIVLHTNMWRLWAGEQKKAKKNKKEQAASLRQTTGTMVAQHMYARLLAVDELLEWPGNGNGRISVLDEWKIRFTRDWFNTTYDKVSEDGDKYLKADPIRVENKTLFEEGWELDEQSKELLSPPEDLQDWFEGEVKGLDKAFQKTLKKQAYDLLNEPDNYYQAQFDDRARLPSRWHEGHEPAPYFWSKSQWDWLAKGNNFRQQPIDLLMYCLKEDQGCTKFHQFAQVLKSLVSIVIPEPSWPGILNIANKLWMGEMLWREFVDDFIDNHLDAGNVTTFKLSEDPAPTNPFNTLEARLVLEGYVRRQNLKTDLPWDALDGVLWRSLTRLSSGMKNQKVWEDVVMKIVAGKPVAKVLSRVTRRISENENLQNAGDDTADVDNQPHDHDFERDTVDKGPGGEQRASSGPSGDDARMDVHDVPHHSMPSPDVVQPDISAGDRSNAMEVITNPLADREHQTDVVEPAAGPNNDSPDQDMDTYQPPPPVAPPPYSATHPPIPPPTTEVPQGDVVKEAVRQLTEYLRDHSLEQYQATLRRYYPADCAAVIKDYVQGMADDDLTQEGCLHGHFIRFCDSLEASKARKEAGEMIQQLL
ncbi:hypothetical protein DEU56DRAFT_760669 [Suillus clintonianus]|uniref:uncharacterized protein n=1 Tax=Suillus clintonianus TaxID=1904413 RepID=UPI001B862F30|nr:uncharacterized protein DEU56DRAFT_760669 [Suillus clintonianus]KAG2121491.1 hypothetical protein DEU56DRAFT_760669 [Suillus clintonianus]